MDPLDTLYDLFGVEEAYGAIASKIPDDSRGGARVKGSNVCLALVRDVYKGNGGFIEASVKVDVVFIPGGLEVRDTQTQESKFSFNINNCGTYTLRLLDGPMLVFEMKTKSHILSPGDTINYNPVRINW